MNPCRQLRRGFTAAVVRVLVVAAGLAVPAVAAASLPTCKTTFLAGLGVENVAIASVNDVAAAGANPEYCAVVAALTTSGEGAGPGLAKFEVKLPANWNHKFLFVGCGGQCGSLANISVNATDLAEALPQGYAIVNTDTGHSGGQTSDAWAIIAPGVPNKPAVIDYFYRGVHQVTVAAKKLVKDYYDSPIDRAYFDGCSTGGRQSLMEAERYPDDYEGLIAGDPVMAFTEINLVALNIARLFAPANAYITQATMTAVDAAVKANCDAADGVVDGLIQNPAKCTFDPQSLVPGTLTQPQATALKLYMSSLSDEHGRRVFPGYVASDLSTTGFVGLWTEETCPANPGTGPEPWGGEPAGCAIGPAGPLFWQFIDSAIKDYTELDPNFDVWDGFPVANGVVTDKALRKAERTMGGANSDLPEQALPFLRKDGKLILYHGFSDPGVSPYQSIWFYTGLAGLLGGYEHAQAGARLFLAPGMAHCGGGPGPNSFDTLNALDAWVSQGVAPDGILATNPASGRTMPLCKYPEEAAYVGGDINKASSWVCRAGDSRLLQIGPDGELAGVGGDPDETLARFLSGSNRRDEEHDAE
jgi:feruloyl esterase